MNSHTLKPGDYVLATKWHDGDPLDHWCIGFYAGSFDHYGTTRHLVNDINGNSFRANGFRRVERISKARGQWILKRTSKIESLARQGYKRSMWGWKRATMRIRKWPD